MADPGPNPTERCVRGEDLTAFAHGELATWHRAEVSRHALRCARCRRALEEAEDVFAQLRALGAQGEGWRDDLADALAARRGRTWIRVLSAGGVAAAAALAFALVGTPHRPDSRPALTSHAAAVAGARDSDAAVVAAPTAARIDPEAARALLAAQGPDGRWPAPAIAGGEPRDEAATGLAILALSPRADDPAVARAVSQAAKWLVERQERRERDVLGNAPRPSGTALTALEDRAVAATALLEVLASTRDPGVSAVLEPAVERAVRRIALESGGEGAQAPGSPAVRWALLALTRARSQGVERLAGAIDRLGRHGTPPAESPGRLLARAGSWGQGPDAEGWALAVRLLRDRASL